MARYLSLLQVARLLHPALVIAPRVCPGLYPFRMAQARRLHAVPMAVLSFRDAGVHQVCLLQTATVPRALRLPQASPSRRAGVGHPACLSHAQTASRLTKALPCHQGLRVPVSREGRAKLLDQVLHLLDLCQRPDQDCLLRAQQHGLAAEHFLGFRF